MTETQALFEQRNSVSYLTPLVTFEADTSDREYTVRVTDSNSPLLLEATEAERMYFGGIISEAPAETEEGLRWFVESGGTVVLQYVGEELDGCLEWIPVSRLLAMRLGSVPQETTLSRLLAGGALKYLRRNDYLVYGWIGRTWRSLRLVFELVQIHHLYGAPVVGFVLASDVRAQKCYDRFGVKVQYVPRLYSDNDAHWLYRLRAPSTLKLRALQTRM